MRITIDSRELQKLIRGLEGMQRQIPAAIARSVNQAGDKTKTKVIRALKDQTGLVRYGSVTSRVKATRAYPGQGAFQHYEIHVSPKATKPFEYKSSVSTGPSGGVTLFLWNVAHRFPRSFLGKGKISGQLRMRVENPRLPTRGFDGANLAREAVKDSSAEAFFATAEKELPEAVIRNLSKLL